MPLATTPLQRDPDRPRRVVIASTGTDDGLPASQVGAMDLARYMQNPVVLWNHDQWEKIPIGRTTRIEQTATGDLVAEFEFLPDDDFAARVKNAWDKGFIHAASVGWRYTDEDGSESQPQLMEWSLVSVPKDPNALAASAGAVLASYDALLTANLGASMAEETTTKPEPKPEAPAAPVLAPGMVLISQEDLDARIHAASAKAAAAEQARGALALRLAPLLSAAGSQLDHTASEEEMLRAAIGDKVQLPEGASPDFMRGIAEALLAAQAQAPPGQPVAPQPPQPGNLVNTSPEPVQTASAVRAPSRHQHLFARSNPYRTAAIERQMEAH